MKVSLSKRLLAFVLDYLILSLIFGIVTLGINVSSNDYTDDLNKIMEKYESSEITTEQFLDEYVSLYCEIIESQRGVNILTAVLYIGYFVIFACLNNGQTIGKKICKIRVVNKDGERANIFNMAIRSLFIYGLISQLFSVIFFNIIDATLFVFISVFISYVEYILMFAVIVMASFRKDGRGLHDIIGRTKVIGEVK